MAEWVDYAELKQRVSIVVRITFLVMGGVLLAGVVLSAIQGSRRTSEVPVDRVEEAQAGGSPPD